MFAARNIGLCTKDCVCLFVCPTGATDTENGQIDAARCVDGCRLCLDACPSHAIYLVYERYPIKAMPEESVNETMAQLLRSKSEAMVRSVIQAERAESAGAAAMFKALAHSARVLAEDSVRESGHIIAREKLVGQLVESGYLQQLYSEAFDETKAPQEILDTVTAAPAGNGDAESMTPYVCDACGYLALEQFVDSCPQCGSEKAI